MSKHPSIIKYIAFFVFTIYQVPVLAQTKPQIEYEISIPNPATHTYHVELQTGGWSKDTLVLKMPKWSPGYYQIMDYANSVKNMTVKDDRGEDLSFQRPGINTIIIPNIGNKTVAVAYDITTSRQFVANSYVDKEHAYLIPANSFFYVEGFLNLPVQIKFKNNPWTDIATGLAPVNKTTNTFTARNFDFLYDCPILLGNLEELPSFKVNGIDHRFIGYKMGDFNKKSFIEKLKQVTQAAVAIIGDIPYERYTYIAIGPGRGGIEHLNNTTFSFDGSTLNESVGVNRMLNFLAHEYFHHYNVKRIRPFELGPFDYQKPTRTNLLWVSEGLNVYYEYLIVRRAGIADEETLFNNLEANINTYQNNPGRFYQTLVQSSYNTWEDGPFGNAGEEPGQTITYYQKGPIVGMFLDFAIRHATHNKKSLDDVMRYLYFTYYKKKNRGFTDAEFRQACEEVANTSLAAVFEYVYTTQKLDYAKYLGYAGLKLVKSANISKNGESVKTFQISYVENPNSLQNAILKSWQGR